ncbi:hypothetical protein SUGI_0354450 [Cryptomeria japonica]|nr:hypothetical protein SUGI_0354450 [Cryptomeria japonica]
MALSKLCKAGIGAAAIAGYGIHFAEYVYAEGPFHFNSAVPKEETRSKGFDPETLERGAKALREINSSSHAKRVFEIMRYQEDTRLAQLEAMKAEYQSRQAQIDIERQQGLYEEQRKLVQQQAQAKAQMARYEDELARKRMQSEHEAQRQQDRELVKMQEESSVRQEQIRRATEEKIQAQQRQTDKE